MSPKKTTPLAGIAEVKAGYPFRGQIKPIPSAGVGVIQMKNVDETLGVDWANLVSTDLQGRRAPDWLEPGDILFAARGNRNTALALESVPGQVVASPHFYQIHVHDQARLLPAFLAWQINQAPAQQYFGRSAEGSMILSIRRGILESLPIAIPPLARQQAIVELDRRVRQERVLLRQKMNNSRAMMNVIARDLINQA